MDAFVHAVLLIVLIIPAVVRAVNQLQIIFTDQTHNIQKGSEVRLTCVVSGGNNPNLTWISTKGQLPLNSVTENNGQTLVISGFDMMDNGQYLCVASDGLHFASHMFSVKLPSTQKPSTTTTLLSSPSTAVSSTTKPMTNMFATLTNIQTTDTSRSQEITTTTTPKPTTTEPMNMISTANGHVHTSGQVCMRCRDVISPAYCTQTIQCGPHEECYLQKYARDGRVLYKQECMPSVACGA
ncbi:mucin-2-like [Ostrea edulis]|uniref:mucin-2-like n=1 Tax=Ostrea edulis TaxID=37623 RepID=UPI0024AFDCA8|nr:mucin-2-like [Ostrea edulis]